MRELLLDQQNWCVGRSIEQKITAHFGIFYSSSQLQNRIVAVEIETEVNSFTSSMESSMFERLISYDFNLMTLNNQNRYVRERVWQVLLFSEPKEIPYYDQQVYFELREKVNDISVIDSRIYENIFLYDFT